MTPPVVEKTIIDIDLRGGVNERDRAELVDWTKYLTTAENLVLDEYRALVKRSGFRYINSSGTDESAVPFYPIYRLLPTKNGLCFVGKDFNLYSVNEANEGTVVKKGRCPEWRIDSAKTVGSIGNYISTGTTGVLGFCVSTTKYTVVSYTSDAQRQHIINVCERKSGNKVKSYTLGISVGGANTIDAAVLNNRYILIAYADGINPPKWTILDAGSVLPSSLPAGTAITGTAGGEDVNAVLPGATFGTIVAVSAAGNTFLEKISTAGASIGSRTIAVTTTSADCNGSIFSDPTKFVLAYVNATPDYVVRFLDAALADTRTVTDTTAAAPAAADILRVAMSSSTEDVRVIAFKQITSTGGINHPSATVYSCAPVDVTFTEVSILSDWCELSHPFYWEATGRFYVALGKAMVSGHTVGSTDTVAGNVVLVDITEAKYVNPPIVTSTRLLRPAAVVDGYTATLDHNNYSTNGVRVFNQSPPRPRSCSAASGNGFENTCILAYCYTPTAQTYAYEVVELVSNSPQAVSVSSDVMSGGKVFTYDNNVPQDLGFYDSPCLFVADIAGTLAAGTYNYVAVYEYKDYLGRSHYSRVSRPASITIAVARSINLSTLFPNVCDHDPIPYNIADFSSTIIVRYYRTTSGGTQYYLVAKTTAGNPVNDSMSDATLVSQPQLFRQPGTQGSAVDRYPPLAGRHVVQHKDRVFYARGSQVYYSSFMVDGEAPWFNPGFSFYVPGGTGDITALASMDGVLVIFKRDAVFIVDGDGPPENGGSGTEFSPPRRMMTEFGCQDHRTLVYTPLGLMYRSDIGFVVLDRSMQVKFIGDRIQRTADAYPYSGGACYDTVSGRAMFAVGSAVGQDGRIGSNSGGRILAYDVTSDAWTTYKSYINGTSEGLIDVCLANLRIPATIGVSHSGTVVVANQYYLYFSADWSIPDWKDQDSTYTPFKMETGWIKLDSAQDRIRVSDFILLAKKMTNHAIKISVAYDYSDTYAYSKVWEPAAINAASPEQLELQVPKQAVTAVRFKIEDQAPADTATYPIGTGNGPDILAVSVKVGKRGGGPKLASEQKG